MSKPIGWRADSRRHFEAKVFGRASPSNKAKSPSYARGVFTNKKYSAMQQLNSAEFMENLTKNGRATLGWYTMHDSTLLRFTRDGDELWMDAEHSADQGATTKGVPVKVDDLKSVDALRNAIRRSYEFAEERPGELKRVIDYDTKVAGNEDWHLY